MDIQYRYTFPYPREAVWEALREEDVLRRRLPGCRRLEKVGEGKYAADLGLQVGPISGLFTGEVELADAHPPEGYRLLLKGEGKPGTLEADALIRLEEADGQTLLTCTAQAQVTGIMASVGQRAMGGIANLLLGQFFKGVEEEIRQRQG
ncbi:MAG: carbon monoxide dehydrogenase subunit G [Clostridiales bacterium]|nr:carbon monoxide dehydrogenase subunit G [Clostridiales bacterium]